MKNNVLKGSVFIALGACSYGMLATFVKIAYHEGYNLAEVTISQFGLGFVGLLILNLVRKQEAEPAIKESGIKGILKLIVGGISLGLTSVCFYQAVRYIPVSVGIVLLMQTVWMSVIMEMVLHKKLPGLRKIISVFIILGGTVLATDMLKQSININWKGFGWGMMAALSYTASMYSSNNIELNSPPVKRSLYLIVGGLLIIVLVFHSSLNSEFSYGIFLRWGLLLSLFGTIIPPLLFTRGMPLTGIGLGAIIASIEIPVSIIIANVLLKESVGWLQWVGVMLILLAVVLMNVRREFGYKTGSLFIKLREK
jgi:drug/metabolite transporter (DMT)-like permease